MYSEECLVNKHQSCNGLAYLINALGNHMLITYTCGCHNPQYGVQ